MTPEETREQTLAHIGRVGDLIDDFTDALLDRADHHDDSKLESPEFEEFVKRTAKLKGMTYGSEEYKAELEAMKPVLTHHYQNNRHHPEHTFAKEEWRDVVGYEGLYAVSTFGRVKSLARVVKRKKQGNIQAREAIRKSHVTPKGYCRIQLKKNGEARNHFVHVLVANTFLGPSPNERSQVNHRDGNKTNNSVDNLEYVTPSRNLNHAYDTCLREPSVKYVVRCVEHDLVTVGIEKMERELRKLGHERVSASGIWRCITTEGYATHQDLTFESWNIDEYRSMHSPVNGMTLIDVVEMFCDWVAASERHENGNPYESLKINKDRFFMDQQLILILRNTLDWILSKDA